MKPSTSQLHARGFIVLALSALLLTFATAEPSGPDIAKRPPSHLKLDQVDLVTGSKRTLAPRKIEHPNARTKAGDAGYWELGEDGAKAPRAKTAKALSGGEAGTLKGMRSNPGPGQASAQYNPKELSVDKR